ncbi:hypothetical protein FRC12_005096 [Ceratobasidium sp. 428]|nr:hypothetical protein FRC12_005096 [Ceratobasidium sp. 428]
MPHMLHTSSDRVTLWLALGRDQTHNFFTSDKNPRGAAPLEVSSPSVRSTLPLSRCLLWSSCSTPWGGNNLRFDRTGRITAVAVA